MRLEIKELVEDDRFIISNHARTRMFQRNVSTDEMIEIINAEMIEDYPDDEPCPSALVLGFLKDIPYHIVVAECVDHVRIIVYKPEEDKWIEYRVRRK
jgi:hypothetical protein